MNSTLYFKNKIDHENMNKISVIIAKTDEKKELKDYIFFDQTKNEEILKYSFNANGESKNKIKEKYIYAFYKKKIDFKGKNFDDISLEINELKSILVEIKKILNSLE